MAAIRMGLRVRTLSPSPSGPVAPLGEALVGDWTDPDVLRPFADGCTAITVESEWAPADVLAPLLPEHVRLYPAPETLFRIRHKGRQKALLRNAGLPVPAFELCQTLPEAQRAAESFGFPVILKRYEGSYDGFGNGTARNAADVESIWEKLAADDGLLVEAFVPFRQELSVLIARRETGVMVAYPPAYTEQRDHRCHAVVVPADLRPEVAERAVSVAKAAARATDAVGMLGVELFETVEGEILVNELAPRPHNTGHYTIEGSHTSQFENHVRAVMGWPLGDPGLRVPTAVMINILGHRSGPVSDQTMAHALITPGASVHIYGKEEVRPSRKMGHVTVTGRDSATTRRLAEEAASAIIL